MRTFTLHELNNIIENETSNNEIRKEIQIICDLYQQAANHSDTYKLNEFKDNYNAKLNDSYIRLLTLYHSCKTKIHPSYTHTLLAFKLLSEHLKPYLKDEFRMATEKIKTDIEQQKLTLIELSELIHQLYITCLEDYSGLFSGLWSHDIFLTHLEQIYLDLLSAIDELRVLQAAALFAMSENRAKPVMVNQENPLETKANEKIGLFANSNTPAKLNKQIAHQNDPVKIEQLLKGLAEEVLNVSRIEFKQLSSVKKRSNNASQLLPAYDYSLPASANPSPFLPQSRFVQLSALTESTMPELNHLAHHSKVGNSQIPSTPPAKQKAFEIFHDSWLAASPGTPAAQSGSNSSNMDLSNSPIVGGIIATNTNKFLPQHSPLPITARGAYSSASTLQNKQSAFEIFHDSWVATSPKNDLMQAGSANMQLANSPAVGQMLAASAGALRSSLTNNVPQSQPEFLQFIDAFWQNFMASLSSTPQINPELIRLIDLKFRSTFEFTLQNDKENAASQLAYPSPLYRLPSSQGANDDEALNQSQDFEEESLTREQEKLFLYVSEARAKLVFKLLDFLNAAANEPQTPQITLSTVLSKAIIFHITDSQYANSHTLKSWLIHFLGTYLRYFIHQKNFIEHYLADSYFGKFLTAVWNAPSAIPLVYALKPDAINNPLCRVPEPDNSTWYLFLSQADSLNLISREFAHIIIEALWSADEEDDFPFNKEIYEEFEDSNEYFKERNAVFAGFYQVAANEYAHWDKNNKQGELNFSFFHHDPKALETFTDAYKNTKFSEQPSTIEGSLKLRQYNYKHYLSVILLEIRDKQLDESGREPFFNYGAQFEAKLKQLNLLEPGTYDTTFATDDLEGMIPVAKPRN